MISRYLKALLNGRRRRLARQRRHSSNLHFECQPLEIRIVPSASAVFSAVTGVLTVTGDAQDNALTVGRDAAGGIQINGGNLAITGGTPTVANVTLIEMFGQGGNDTLALDETNGPLPAASLFGGAGNDTLVGGSGADSLHGDSGNDTLLGKGGIDLLFGGSGSDTLTAGTGDDQAFGESGNDRLIWNPGEGSDLNEGGDGFDTIEVNGANVSEDFTIAAVGTRVRFDRVSPAPFFIDIGASESLIVNGNGGDDSVSAGIGLAPLISLTIDGGAGSDTLLGGDGNDLLIGGDGNDFVDGNRGSDVAQLGAGDDVFQWDPGDGSDVVEGGDNLDTMLFNGSTMDETFDLSANGSRLRFFRDVGTITMDVNDTERVNVEARGGLDTVNIGNLAATDVIEVNVNLAADVGGTTPDGASDQVNVNGTNAADSVEVLADATGVSVVGLPALVTIRNGESTDLLTVNLLGGNDAFNASTALLPMQLTVDGGNGSDSLLGSRGVETLMGGNGNDFADGQGGKDTAILGAGNDVFQWDPGDGSDVVEGGIGTDTMLFNGSSQNEIIDLSANGERLRFTRSPGNIVMDVNDTERVTFVALGGADQITVNDLTGTDVTLVTLDLGATAGAALGDGAADAVIVNGTAGTDAIRVDDPAGKVTVRGLTAAIDILTPEAIDQLMIQGFGGADTLAASRLAAGVIGLTLSGGDDNDFLVGSAGNDLIIGGRGADAANMGAGDDTFVWNPGEGSDVVEGRAGFDTMQFNGADANENIDLSADGARLRFFRTQGTIVMDVNDTERINFAALGGADNVVIHDLTGTDVTEVNVDLAATGGGPDGAGDVVTVEGSAGADFVHVDGSIPGTVAVKGLVARVNVINPEAANDQLVVNSVAGNDVVEASGLAAGVIQFTADGGEGNDVLVGSAGDDSLIGGNGDDLLIGGPGQDVLEGGPGNNTLIQS